MIQPQAIALWAMTKWLCSQCFQNACRKRSMMTDNAATRSLNGVSGKECRSRLRISALDEASLSAKAATMARAVSASGRPLSVAGTMVTSPNGLGG